MDLLKTTTSLTSVGLPTTSTLYTTEFDTTDLKAGHTKRMGAVKAKFSKLKNCIFKDRTVEYKRVKADGTYGRSVKIKGNRISSTLTTTSTTATTAFGNDKISDKYQRTIYNRSLNAQVEALSDEELETALQHFNLLEPSVDKVDVETHIK